MTEVSETVHKSDSLTLTEGGELLRTTAGLDAVAELGFIGVGVDKQQTTEGR